MIPFKTIAEQILPIDDVDVILQDQIYQLIEKGTNFLANESGFVFREMINLDIDISNVMYGTDILKATNAKYGLSAQMNLTALGKRRRSKKRRGRAQKLIKSDRCTKNFITRPSVIDVLCGLKIVI